MKPLAIQKGTTKHTTHNIDGIKIRLHEIPLGRPGDQTGYRMRMNGVCYNYYGIIKDREGLRALALKNFLEDMHSSIMLRHRVKKYDQRERLKLESKYNNNKWSTHYFFCTNCGNAWKKRCSDAKKTDFCASCLLEKGVRQTNGYGRIGK